MHRPPRPCSPVPRLAVALLVCGGVLTALPAQRMRIGSSNPTGLRAGAGFSDALFAAGDTTHGVELWRWSTAGTARIVDVYPGPLSGYPTGITRRSPSSGHTWLVARARSASGAELGRELFFYPSLPTSSAGFWIRDIRPGPAGSHPQELTLLNGRLLFTADDGVAGRELWASGGTLASTVRLKDIRPGAQGSNPFGLTVYNNRVYFAATTAAGTELWATDGTATGTVLVRDIRAGAASSTPTDFAVYQQRLYFAATTNANGRELWCTDGSSSGTVLVADLVPGPASSSPSQLTAGADLAFTAHTAAFRRELYIKGPSGAPVRHSNLARGETIAELTPVGKAFYFRAHSPTRGFELWRTTPTGIQLVHDLRAGAGSSFPSNLYADGSRLFFRADDGATGVEYWRTDGTTASQLRDIRAGKCAARPSRLTPVTVGGRRLFLFAAKGDKNGIELWRTTGVSAALAQDIDSQPVLPELHWHSSPAGTGIDIKDGTPNAPGVILIGTAVTGMFTLPFLRGAVTIDLTRPNLLLFFRTDPRGEATFAFPNVPITNRTSIVSQIGVATGAGILEMSVPGSCNQGSVNLNPLPNPPPNGPRVEGRICLDDESGEYTFCALRTDLTSVNGYLGLYQKGSGGDLQFLQACPIAPGEFLEDAGQIEILLPLAPGDPTGRHLELHLFTEPPTPSSPTPSSLVTTSYC